MRDGKLNKFPLKPRLFEILKKYSFKLFQRDIKAGLIVSVVSIPLSMAFAIAAGASPAVGLLTAVVSGIVAAIFTGSNFQITGPTGAVAIIVFSVIKDFGFAGLLAATFMAGVFLILFGLLRAGSVVKIIARPIVLAFTMGIAVSIFIGQIPDFVGLSGVTLPAKSLNKLGAVIANFPRFDLVTVLVGVFSVAAILVLNKISKKIPAPLVIIVLVTVVCRLFSIDLATIGSQFGDLTLKFAFAFPLQNV